MKGRVSFWKQDFRDYPEKVFGWGFLVPLGGNEKNDRVYFCTRSARYSPVRQHDLVEFELYQNKTDNHRGPSAFKVEKIDDEDDHDREAITTIPGEFNT